jgi:hypothetical protein
LLISSRFINKHGCPQVSVHLANQFQRRRFKCEKLTDDRCQVMVNGKRSHCLWQGEIRRGVNNRKYINLGILYGQQQTHAHMGDNLFSEFIISHGMYSRTSVARTRRECFVIWEKEKIWIRPRTVSLCYDKLMHSTVYIYIRSVWLFRAISQYRIYINKISVVIPRYITVQDIYIYKISVVILRYITVQDLYI